MFELNFLLTSGVSRTCIFIDLDIWCLIFLELPNTRTQKLKFKPKPKEKRKKKKEGKEKKKKRKAESCTNTDPRFIN